MSKDKYPNVFLCQMEAIVFTVSFKEFFAKRVLLKIGAYHSDTPGIFSHVTRLDLSRASKNI